MELKDFIKRALIDLISGVDEAKLEFVGKQGSLICPPIGPAYTKEFGLNIDVMGRYYQKVEFDIAVTVAEETSLQGKADGKVGFIKVFSASASVDGNVNTNNSTVSRVKFHVPIALQCVTVKNGVDCETAGI